MSRQSFDELMDSLAASTPAPGGGTAAALTGVMAAALVQMVANLTLGKKKYQQVEQDMQSALVLASELRGRLSQLSEEDARAYEDVMHAYKLPKTTPEDDVARAQAVGRALHRAAEVPLKTAQAALQVLEAAHAVADKGNPNALTDAGVAALLAEAALKAALYNVRVNTAVLNPRPLWAQEMEQECSALETAATLLSQAIASRVTEKIS